MIGLREAEVSSIIFKRPASEIPVKKAPAMKPTAARAWWSSLWRRQRISSELKTDSKFSAQAFRIWGKHRTDNSVLSSTSQYIPDIPDIPT